MKTLIRGGTVVTPRSSSTADLLVDGERLARVGPDLDPRADRTIDARGKLVLPGGVDVHTHLDMPLSGSLRTADDFESGTRAAAFGGTTTIVDYATPARGEPIRAALDDWMARALGRAVVDFGFHATISSLQAGTEEEMEAMVRAGVPSFKVFMAYPGRLMLDDGEIFRVLRRAAEVGGLVCVHAENGSVIEVLVREALDHEQLSPAYHALTRPPQLEAEAVRRAIALADLAGAPLYVVHLSSAGGLEAVVEARRRGAAVVAETCPQYLFLSDDVYRQADLEAAKYVMSPPLRDAAMGTALRAGLAAGDIQVVATDHCPFLLGDKAASLGDFSRIPNGVPGIEARLLLLYQGVVAGWLSLQQMVEVTAAAPARVFGLAPEKGTIAEGADADLVILDPRGTTRISAATHHSRADYDPYEGRELSGAIELVLSRGEVVVEGDRFVGCPGRGRFLRRRPFEGF